MVIGYAIELPTYKPKAKLSCTRSVKYLLKPDNDVSYKIPSRSRIVMKKAVRYLSLRLPLIRVMQKLSLDSGFYELI